MARYDKDAWKSQAKAAILGGLASELTTTLIKAPFEEPRQKFLLHDQKGKELNRRHKELSTEQSYYDTTRQTISESKLDGLAWFQKKHLDAMKAHLTDRYTNYADDVFVQNGMAKLREEANRLGQEEYDEFIAGEKKLSIIPDRATFEARVDRYSPRSKNWGQALFRRGRRFARGQSYEDYADDAIRSMTAGTGLDLTDEDIAKIRKDGIQARRPVNKEGVLTAVENLLNTKEVKVGMEQQMQARRNGLAITADRLNLEKQNRDGNMDRAFGIAYNELDAKRLAEEDGHPPSTPQVLALMRKNFKDSFVADDNTTRTNMIEEWKKDPKLQAYHAKMLDSVSVWVTQDENQRNGIAFDQLVAGGNKDDIDAVRDKAEAILSRVYSVARDRTLVQLQRGYDAESLPRDFLGGTPSARMLQKEMIFQNATSILEGGLEKGMGEDVVVNQRVGWWDTKEAREYLTGAIIAPGGNEFIQGVMDQINKVGAQADEYFPAVGDPSDETVDTDAATGTTDPKDFGPAGPEGMVSTIVEGLGPDFQEQQGLAAAGQRLRTLRDTHYDTQAERDQKAEQLRVESRAAVLAIAQSYIEKGTFDNADDLYDAVKSGSQILQKDIGVDDPYAMTPSSEGSGLGKDRKEAVKFNLPVSPYITTDVDEVVRAEGSDEQFNFEVKKDGSVDINFKGTTAKKPSGWSLPKLTPDNNINIDDITNMNIYNHLRDMAEKYDEASKEDKPHIIAKVDFGYGEEGPAGTIEPLVLGEDTALVKDLFSQFNARYKASDTQALEYKAASPFETFFKGARRRSTARELPPDISPSSSPSLLVPMA